MRSIANPPNSGWEEKTAVLEDKKPLLTAKLGFAPGAPFAAALIPTEQPPFGGPLHPFTTNHDASPEPASGPTVPLPQTIAHRGYKAEYPENTMDAFAAALATGAHALETDVHLSRDGVVVLSHDATLARCFGRPDKIADVDWAELATLRTLRSPNSPMPRLVDLLMFLASPRAKDTWILIDIKRDDDAEELVRRLAEAIASVPSGASEKESHGGARPWAERIVLGCWDARYMKLCRTHLAGFAVAYIGWSLPYARHLLRYEGVHFNLQQRVLVGPWGKQFVRQARARGRRVFVWTVNKEEWMEWSIRRAVDGVITDDPKLFGDVCRRWEGESAETARTGRDVRGRAGREAGAKKWAKLYANVVVMQVAIMLYTVLMRIALGTEKRRIQQQFSGR